MWAAGPEPPRADFAEVLIKNIELVLGEFEVRGQEAREVRDTILAREEMDESCFAVNVRDVEWIRDNKGAELIAGEEGVA